MNNNIGCRICNTFMHTYMAQMRYGKQLSAFKELTYIFDLFLKDMEDRIIKAPCG